MRISSALLLLPLVLPTACARAEAPSEARGVVSLVPGVTELVHELGLADRLVARASDDPLMTDASVPDVGPLLSPSVEKLTELRPRWILAWPGMPAMGDLRSRASRWGGEVVEVELSSLTDVPVVVDQLAELLGATSTAGPLRRELSALLARASDDSSSGWRFLWVVDADASILAGPGSHLHEIAVAAGGTNSLPPGASAWPRIGPEVLVAADPDVVIWPDDGPPPTSRTQWARLAAVRSDRVVLLAPAQWEVPGLGVLRRIPHLADSVSHALGR